MLGFQCPLWNFGGVALIETCHWSQAWEIIDSHHLNSTFLYFTPLVKRRGPSASFSATMPPFCHHEFFLFHYETLKLKQTLPSVSCLAVLYQSNRKQLTVAEGTTPGAAMGEGSWPWVWPQSCSLSFSVSGCVGSERNVSLWGGMLYAQDWVGETSWCHVDRMRSSWSWSVSHIWWVRCDRTWCQSEN